MNPKGWQQLDQLFQLAVECAPSERAAFLDAACAGDESLHKQIEQLLTAHDKAESFIEQPAIDVEARALARQGAHANPQLTTDQIFGHYRILELLGAGGMGEVYLAEDTTLGRKVALKLLPAEFAEDKDRLHRFKQEAHAASALNHPNIITIHEIAQVDDRHLIATEFIDGETLRERIRGSRSQTSEDGSKKAGTGLPIREVLNIGIQIADALAAAHEAGIVHRDITPENIMVRRRDGYIKVLDFGLAKLSEPPAVAGGFNVDTEAVTRAQLKTSAGLVMGTLTYMSPEQTRGEKVDQRTDIWSLGVVLYELIAGCAPFDRPTASEVIAAILDHDPPPLTDHVAAIPTELQRIISKALTKDRELRYQTAKDLLFDLSHLQHDWELEEKVEWPSSGEVHPTTPTETSRQAIPSFLLRAMIAHKWALLISLVVIALVVVAVIYRSYFTPGREPIDSIAVLPFVNSSGDPNTDYLSDGISESLINSLTELQQLRVMARATAFHYKNKDVDPKVVGRELDVRAVLMGRVRQLGDTLNIQVDLVDTATGAQLWGKEYERKVPESLSVKQLIALEVTQKLRLGLSSDQQQKLSKGDATNAEAYEFYLRGRYYWNKRTVDDLSKAIEQFQHAIDRDPNYALAYVGLTDSYVSHALYANTPTREMLPRAREAVERALQIDDSLAEAHASRGQIERDSWNYTEAEKEYKRAIELNPKYATAHHFYSLFLRAWRGRFDEAMVEIKLAQQLDPLSPIIGSNVAASYMAKGELEAAIEAAKRVIELEPSFPEAHRQLCLAYRRQGRYEEAIAEGEKAVQLSKRYGWSLAVLGVSYAVGGHTDKAREILKELEDRYPQHTALGQQIAYVSAVLGEKEQAFAWLEKDYQAHSGPLPFIAYAEENTLRESLRGDPRWSDLLRRMGLMEIDRAN